ncbi:hypothetical protein BIY24_05925 [Halobacteriovorax marinus]|uniref:hypothetical protein n=1 Tax=Halobacteriovorax marinus TaxID=97084 RepID=UPI000BC2C86F|nr:hypothetical protein [Halobacteriovorax marinus]ATH07497.1 hypothetical protein BIY24_05925 [Halobacteriovorax marinus]
MKKNLFFILFIFICGQLAIAHELIYESKSSDNQHATAVYHDKESGKIVVQKFDFSNSSVNGESFKFPKNVNSFASVFYPLEQLRPNIRQEMESIDLNQSSPDIQVELEKITGASRPDAREVMLALNQKIYNQRSNVVLSTGEGLKKSLAVVSSSNGRLTLAKGRNRKMTVPENISFPRDIVNRLSSRKSRDLDISSPGKLSRVLSSFNSLMREYEFDRSVRDDLLKRLSAHKRVLDSKIEKMSLVKSINKDGEKYDLFMNLEDGSFYLRRTKGDRIVEDDFYPLNDDKNLEDLKSKLERYGLYNKSEFDNTFKDFYVQSCEQLEGLYGILPELDENISSIMKITDRLWGSYLESAVSNKPIVLADGSMVLSISALNESHNVKVKYNSDGSISDLSFVNEAKAQRGNLEIVEVIENGKKIFKIKLKSDEGDIDQFIFDTETDSNGKSKLSVYVRGASTGDTLYDKNDYPLVLSSNKVTSVGNRVQLSKTRVNPYPSNISKVDGGGVKSFIFNNFFSLEDKREKLADEVRTAVGSQIDSINKDGNEYLNPNEINSIVLDIVRDVERDIPELEADISRLTAKTYEHAYKNFVNNIVPKMIKDLVPGESDEFYSEIAKSSMVDFHKCLEAASSRSNEKAAEACMNAYMKEAPVKIGESILIDQIKSNNQSVILDTVVSEYNKCIKENYDNTLDMGSIKGCIYKAIFTSVDKDIEKVVSFSLSEMERDYKNQGKDITLRVDSSTLAKAKENLRKCYQDSDFIRPRFFNDNYNQQKLNTLEVDEFKNSLFKCTSRIEQVVGREVSGIVLDNELSSMGIEGTERESIKERTILNGYDNCISIQSAQANLREERGEFYKVEAAKCTQLVTLTATNEVITKTLKEKLGTELWDDLATRDQAPHLKCFEDLKSKARDQLIESNDSIDFETSSADCLKESVIWASFYLGKTELAKIFESDPLYRKVQLNEERKSYYASLIQSCFKEKLKEYSEINKISSSLDKIQDQCSVELIMSESAKDDILSPIVTGMLEDSGVDAKIISDTKDTIVSKMSANVANALKGKSLSLEEVITEFKKIQGEATYLVADRTVDQYVRDMIDPERADAVSASLREKVFNGEYDFRSKILSANGSDELNRTVDEMTEIVAINLTEEASRSEGMKLLEKGILKNENDVEKLARGGRSSMEQCLRERPANAVLKEYLDSCVLKVKTEVTYDVFDDQLKSILFEGDFAGSFSASEKQELYSKFINEDLKSDISKAYADDGLNEFQNKFTLRATSAIGERVIKKSVLDIYMGKLTPNDANYQATLSQGEVVASVANTELQNCLSSQDGKEIIDTDSCIDRARLKATELVFKDKITPFVSLLSSNKNVQNQFVDSQISTFKKCTQDSKSTAKEYTDAVNSCLLESIFNMVQNLVVDASKSTDFLADLSERDLGALKGCIEDSKRDLVKSNRDFQGKEALRSELYSKIEKGEEFWLHYFNESPSEDSQKKVDWAIALVQECGISSAVPSVLRSLRMSSRIKENLDMNRSQELYTINAISSLENFAKESFEDGNWLTLESVEGSGEDSSSGELELKTIDEYMREYMPMVGEYLKKLHDYDSAGSKELLDKFLQEVRSEIKNKKKLSLEDLKALLMKSDLMDLIIESEVASFVMKEARAPLAEQGVGEQTILQLGSKEVIGKLFDSTRGREIISQIKSDFISPMLQGEGGKEIPESIVTDVKKLLVSDTKNGGFVETLAGAIVQNKLEEKRPKNFATSGIASVLGYDSADFKWSNLRSRRASGVSDSEQPVQQAMEYFGDQILLPMLMKEDLGSRVEKGIFSNTKIDIMQERQDKFSEMVEEIMDL